LSKKIIVGILIALAIGGYLTIGSPIEKSDDSKSISKKAEENIKQEVVQEVTKQTIEPLSEQAIQSSCKDPASQMCFTAKWYVFATSLAIALIFAALMAAGIIALFHTIWSLF